MSEKIEVNNPIWETTKYSGFRDYKLIIYGITPSQKMKLDLLGEFKVTIEPIKEDG